MPASFYRPLALVAVTAAVAAAPLHAEDAAPANSVAEDAASSQPAPPPPAPPPAFAMTRPVYDEAWATIGLGAGLVPSYAGSDDYIAFPLPLIVGRVGGVGVRPNGPGLAFDLLSPKPTLGKRKTRLALGPTFRLRNDRSARIGDPVAEAAGKIDTAVEVGANVAVSFPGVLRPLDTLSLGVQVRRDVLGAHDGTVIEPQVNYASPIGRAVVLQVQAGMEFVDDDFAATYFSITPAQRLASGLPTFTAEGGLNRAGTLAIVSYDLSGNALDGGWSLFGVGGYSRLLGDAAHTPLTSQRGDPNQFILGAGVGYTF
jgi:outer membrane scaffolding protein for murein synthesis (MipA/OmpV family)